MIRFRMGFLALAVTLLALPAQPAQAQFIGYGGEKIIKVIDLPDTPEYVIPDGPFQGRYLDVGAVYKQFTILFLPLNSYEVRWVGYVASDTEYSPIPEETLRAAAAEAGTPMPEQVPIPFWDAWGGRLAFGGIVLLIIVIALISARRKRAPQY